MLNSKKIILNFFLLISVACPVIWHFSVKSIYHYVFFNRDRNKISQSIFLTGKIFDGAQIKYTWSELEPEKGKYDFSKISQDLEFLISNGKKLFVQLQDVSFDDAIINVPEYLLDKDYNGGIARQYNISGGEDKAVSEGWVSRRWDPLVQERFYKLLFALAKEFDGKIEGINLPETAIGFGITGKLFPAGFTFEKYRDAIIKNMAVLRQAFKKSIVMQYANFMPGEWLPDSDKSYLRDIYSAAKELKISIGGPDLLPYRSGQMQHSYPLIRECKGIVPTGIAVQFGNYECVNSKTEKSVTIEELVEFATSYLKVDYIFWSIQEPFFSQNLMTFLKNNS